MEPSYKNYAVYLREDHHAQPKERDKLLVDLIANRKVAADESFLDVGCATGALIGYLQTKFPDFRFTGIDVFPELISEARRKVPSAIFHIRSAIGLSDDWKGRFGISVCTGVLGIFDEAEAQKVLDGLIAVTRPGGLVYVFANFNDVDADVLVTHRKWRNGVCGEWEKGWNIYSRRTIASWISGKAKSFRFIPFEMPFPIERVDDPSRTYTFRDEQGHLLLANGLRILANLEYLEIQI